MAFRPGRFVVRLTNELPILHQIELVPRVERPRARRTGKAPEVVHVGLGPTHHLRRRDALPAPCALGPEPPGTTAATIVTLSTCYATLQGLIFNFLISFQRIGMKLLQSGFNSTFIKTTKNSSDKLYLHVRKYLPTYT